MNDLIKLTVDELRLLYYGPTCADVAGVDLFDELARRAQANDAMRATLSNWCVQFGAALCPTAGSADSFGDGMRAAKKQVSRILAAAPTAASSGAPAPVDQDAKLRDAVAALETVATKQQKVELRDAAHRILQGYSPCMNCGKWARRSECHWPCNPIGKAPPAPVAPVADGEVEAAIAVWPMVPICVFCSKVLSGAAGKDAAFATAAKHAVECAENPLMRERDEANRRVAKAESDRAYLDEKLESIEYALADDIKGEHGRVDGDSVLRVIARRVAEARGHGLRELRARLLSTAGSLPNRQMGHSDEDFDRGYVEACENWAQEIDRLLAAPPAGNGGA